MTDYTELVARLHMRSATQPENFGLDDEAADAIKAQDAELVELREQLQAGDHIRAGLEAELTRVTAELEKVNNEFGSQTAYWPDAWMRVAQVKEDSGRYWREAQQLRAERDAAVADAERYRWLRDRLLAADFAYGDPPTCAVVFKWPESASIGADLDAAIDAASQEEKP